MIKVKVWGPQACFTSLEARVERVSYPVMTPSAARGVLSAIYWKPEFRFLVRRIHVLKPIQRISIMTNEVRGKHARPFLVEEDRTQRYTLALKDVAYVIEAEIEPNAHDRDGKGKHYGIFERRLRQGQCFEQPYLGMRGFSGYFEEATGNERAIDVTQDFGSMLMDLHWRDQPGGKAPFVHHDAHGSALRYGEVEPVMFEARLDRGVLHVPRHLYQRVYG